LPHNHIESSEAPLPFASSHQHDPKKTFASPPSEELFSESEWSKLIDYLALPERQADILYLLLHGENDKQIARKLKISLPTLRTHLQRMYGRSWSLNWFFLLGNWRPASLTATALIDSCILNDPYAVAKRGRAARILLVSRFQNDH
jgi:hypothetical protein